VRAFRWADGLYARFRERHLDPKGGQQKDDIIIVEVMAEKLDETGGRIFAGVLKSS
jgi:hypothetical protein